MTFYVAGLVAVLTEILPTVEALSLLVPRCDMKPYGVPGDVDSDVMFAAWFDGIPLRDFGASILVRCVFLARGPIGGQQGLDSREQITESCLRGWAGGI